MFCPAAPWVPRFPTTASVTVRCLPCDSKFERANWARELLRGVYPLQHHDWNQNFVAASGVSKGGWQLCGCGVVIQPFQNFQATAGAACAGRVSVSYHVVQRIGRCRNLARIQFIQGAACLTLFAQMSTDLGTCSHPDCPWRGQRINFPKHKDGCGKPENRRAGKHEGCTCCTFVPDLVAAPELSNLQQTLALLPAYQQSSVHPHLHGEFRRRADINGRM